MRPSRTDGDSRAVGFLFTKQVSGSFKEVRVRVAGLLPSFLPPVPVPPKAAGPSKKESIWLSPGPLAPPTAILGPTYADCGFFHFLGRDRLWLRRPNGLVVRFPPSTTIFSDDRCSSVQAGSSPSTVTVPEFLLWLSIVLRKGFGRKRGQLKD
jgi:hypothetical protein